MKLLLIFFNICLFIFFFFISACSSKQKNSLDSLNVEEIEILSEIPGSGIKIKNHYKITAHYIGTLDDGTEFDNSFKINKPIKFQIGLRKVIPGWDIALMGMQVGGKRKIKIPPSLAYGKKGVKDLIPPNSTLIFEVEIIDIETPGYKEIDPEEFVSMQKKGLIVIDIRTEEERGKTGVISDSYPLTAFDSQGNLDPNFIIKFQSIATTEDYVVFVSDQGEISSILANGFVERLGRRNVYSLKGGIHEWMSQGNNIIQN